MSDIPRQAGMDPAGGSRESQGDRDDLGRPGERPFSSGGTGDVPQPRGGGITNRPREEERSQDAVPDRGHAKDEEQAGRGPV